MKRAKQVKKEASSLTSKGKATITDEQIIEAAKRPAREMVEVLTDRTAREFAARLKHMVWLLYDGGMKIVELGISIDFSRRTGQRTKTLEEITKQLEPLWRYIKYEELYEKSKTRGISPTRSDAEGNAVGEIKSGHKLLCQ